MGHTPGPWQISKANCESGYVAIDSLVKHGSRDAFYALAQVAVAEFDDEEEQVSVPCEEGAANARLIAAAPELLEACKAIAGVYEGHEDVPLYVRRARAAILKAEGK